jgi:hypothetical protein
MELPRALPQAFVLVPALLLAASAASLALTIEAESLVGSFNAGGDDIYTIACSGASGGMAVEGVDTAGDWIEIMVTIPDTYVYVDSLRSAGLLNLQSHFALTVFGAAPGGADVTSAYHPIGFGIG